MTKIARGGKLAMNERKQKRKGSEFFRKIQTFNKNSQICK